MIAEFVAYINTSHSAVGALFDQFQFAANQIQWEATRASYRRVRDQIMSRSVRVPSSVQTASLIEDGYIYPPTELMEDAYVEEIKAEATPNLSRRSLRLGKVEAAYRVPGQVGGWAIVRLDSS